MNWRDIQLRLDVRGFDPGGVDGVAGPKTYAALFEYIANRSLGDKGVALGKGAAKHFATYWIDTPLRLTHFLAQAAHETGGFKWLREIWGPTPAQRRYEGRADLGNLIAGDGKRYLGRGIFQLTGRSNYEAYGKLCGVDLACSPELAETPETSVHIACEYWKAKGLNALADADKTEAITRKINGGVNGLADRVAMVTRAKGILL